MPQAQARYFDLLNDDLHFTPEERTHLEHNGFFVTDRLKFEQFKRAYAYIYWKDWPVLITTDSILHALHQTYDELLKQIEVSILTDKLIELLRETRAYVRSHADKDERLKSYMAELDVYLSAPLVLLQSDFFFKFPQSNDLPPVIWDQLKKIRQINHPGYHSNHRVDENGTIPQVIGIETVDLFGLKREIDFTLFQARGHYDDPYELIAYFAAMTWLALLDFCFVTYDDFGNPLLQRGQLVAAHLLREAIEGAGQRENWNAIDQLLQAFIGWSDNITLNGLDQFIEDVGIDTPLDYLETDESTMLHLLLEENYGHQTINGEIRGAIKNQLRSTPKAISFALIGQRFTIESWIMQELVYDRLIVNGAKVPRAYPSTLDVMYALGNDRALIHLNSELEHFGYRQNLDDLRQQVSTYSSEFWENSFYDHWLQTIRTLNHQPESPHLPQMMKSPAWSDKMLHTQLASWTQLRHDNILYIKPPSASAMVCEFPAGYVEPYPAFYAALSQYARFGRQVMTHAPVREMPEQYEQIKECLEAQDLIWTEREKQLRPYLSAHIRQTVLTYFENLEKVAARLEALSLKELAGESFNEDDNLFLRSVMVRKFVGDTHYGGYTEEDWTGWYNDLLPFGDESPRLVADVFTNLNKDIAPVGVLHMGTGEPVVMIAGANDTVYIGPVFTCYEHLEAGSPPNRLTDDEWYARFHPMYWGSGLEDLLQKPNLTDEKRSQLEAKLEQEKVEYVEALQNIPQMPDWASSFRLNAGESRKLHLPAVEDYLELSHELLTALRGAECLRRKDGSMRELQRILRTDPQVLLNEKGFSPELLDELNQKMRAKGYLDGD